MDLSALLKKTKNKAKKAPVSKRQRVNIAADDRPYDLDIEEKEIQSKLSQHALEVEVKSDLIDENRTQTVHKVNTNHAQEEVVRKTVLSENALEVEVKSNLIDENRTQTVHKVNTSRTQKEVVRKTALVEHASEVEVKADLIDENRTQTVHKVNTNRTQEDIKVSAPDVNLLVGVQKDIFMFIYKQASYHKDRVTRPLTLVEISQKVGCKVGAVKTSVARLKEKNYVMRYEYKKWSWRLDSL
ncbi:hypothetical protein GW535_17960 (plasmid) [Piscirickettsia salmonis]|uniref:hypothetical protein n=1 Tax=Piscirickettsia salmonis TaxID=1238 RepID=UPI00137C31EB|nr:hypothetical protein [Piscirickettsia salmonis]QHS34380.1 hypothetical protein GW535_17960 [Piscirickettsia salmonis]